MQNSSNTQTAKNQIIAIIDKLKATCASYGIGNDGNEYKIIISIFLYKFLNDKFAYEAPEPAEPAESAAYIQNKAIIKTKTTSKNLFNPLFIPIPLRPLILLLDQTLFNLQTKINTFVHKHRLSLF